MSMAMMNNRWNEARDAACMKAVADKNQDLAVRIKEFQFRDIRPRAASDIEDISQASKLLGHSSEKITRDVYRRVGEIVKPTK